MLFNSFSFLIFFPIVILCYYVIPTKFRNFWLLVCSYYFYMNWNAKYGILLALSTLITYVSSLLIAHFHDRVHMKRLSLFFCFFSNLTILFLFKYLDFAFQIAQKAFSICHISFEIPVFDIVLPVGISFYTFQALSYTADVYTGKLKAERNLLRYALFVSFFPQLVAGPIERSRTLLTQFQATDASTQKYPAFHYEKAKEGLFLMLLGYFEKTIVAYRASIFVDTIYNDYPSHHGFSLILATFFFAIQIYCDFGGYSHIAIGASKVLGIDLMDNFHRPYFATSIQDFWRRWHISLSTWFRDYLYIPLGGNRKGVLRKYCNLLITFLVSGLWHGASMHYVIWGVIHGLYQIVGSLLKPVKEKTALLLHLTSHPKLYAMLQRLLTFFFVCIAWVFFRANSLRDSLMILRSSISGLDLSFFVTKEFLDYGLNGTQFSILLFSLFILFLIDLLQEKELSLYKLIGRLPPLPRWLIYFAIITPVFLQAVASFGEPASTFIYFQF